ncbi:MAG: hypothetical protein ACKORE_04915 [Bacteroidota bacterium]
MPERHLHIVSFDIPWPADYGGVIDVYNKLRHLRLQGWEISLHCFRRQRAESKKLEEVCREVFFYNRNTSLITQFRKTPFIAASRTSDLLVQRLLETDSPILLEGLHSCAPLKILTQSAKNVWVRTHNIEHDYYKGLARSTHNPITSVFFRSEAWKLKEYERVLAAAHGLACISPDDTDHFQTINTNSHFIGPFHPHDLVSPIEGRGDFMLYHGALSVPENQAAVRWILDEVVPKTGNRLIVAGKNPPDWMTKRIQRLDRVSLIADPESAELDQLIRDAQIHLLPATQATGVKLKLIHALFRGRHVLVNEQMVAGTGLETFCHLACSGEEFAMRANELMQKPFSSADCTERENLENSGYSNRVNAEKLSKLLQA